MKKVLITGAAGFIGSHLTELCLAKNLEVTVLIRYNSKNNWGWLESINNKNIRIITGDVRDYDLVCEAVKGQDTVFHLAALIGIPYSYLSPLAYIKTNIEGTYNILQACKQYDTEKVIITSTSETYGTAQFVPITEEHPMVGQSPYSASKIGADQMALSYFKSFNLPVKIVRPFNTYGPRQSARAIIPTVISQLLDQKTALKLGNLAPTRDLTFVKDTVAGFMAIAEADGLFGEITNIGMKEEISIGDLVHLIAQLMGKDIEIIQDSERVRPEKSEVERLFCCNDKIIQSTNWRPQYNLNKGLTETIEWMKNYQHLYKSDIYNV